MARCTSIWLVFGQNGGVRATFSVRHEMVTWVRKQDDPADWHVFRYRDNPRFADDLPVRVDMGELL